MIGHLFSFAWNEMLVNVLISPMVASLSMAFIFRLGLSESSNAEFRQTNADLLQKVRDLTASLEEAEKKSVGMLMTKDEKQTEEPETSQVFPMVLELALIMGSVP